MVERSPRGVARRDASVGCRDVGAAARRVRAMRAVREPIARRRGSASRTARLPCGGHGVVAARACCGRTERGGDAVEGRAGSGHTECVRATRRRNARAAANQDAESAVVEERVGRGRQECAEGGGGRTRGQRRHGARGEGRGERTRGLRPRGARGSDAVEEREGDAARGLEEGDAASRPREERRCGAAPQGTSPRSGGDPVVTEPGFWVGDPATDHE